ncbi:MAG: ribonuclease PH [Chloroflexi bacterium]|nr:ribonuclease PH [Chloroflexota bacterium]
MKRIDGRTNMEQRKVKITAGVQAFAEGSAIIELGQTKVLCAASLEDRVPPFLKGTGQGWVTAEYAMLPRATLTRTPRETGRPSGRSMEIQRLIGRSLRAVTDLRGLGEKSFVVDCDVLQADGGTRTASITGAYVALYQAFSRLARQGVISTIPLRTSVAAVSAGIVGRELLLDLAYDEDSRAEVDLNVVMTKNGEFVEIQGTAEGKPFAKQQLDSLLALAERGIKELFQAQDEAIAKFGLTR